MTPNHELQSLALNDAKHKAFHSVCRLATKVLTEGNPQSFELISNAFKTYKVCENADIDYLIDHETQYSLTLYIATAIKSPEDLYWNLPAPIKKLWDAIPELKKWRGR